MSRTPTQRRNSASKAAVTPRQVALVLPHAAAIAGSTFESALELLDSDLKVHKLWQGEQKKGARRAKPTRSAS